MPRTVPLRICPNSLDHDCHKRCRYRRERLLVLPRQADSTLLECSQVLSYDGIGSAKNQEFVNARYIEVVLVLGSRLGTNANWVPLFQKDFSYLLLCEAQSFFVNHERISYVPDIYLSVNRYPGLR